MKPGKILYMSKIHVSLKFYFLYKPMIHVSLKIYFICLDITILGVSYFIALYQVQVKIMGDGREAACSIHIDFIEVKQLY